MGWVRPGSRLCCLDCHGSPNRAYLVMGTGWPGLKECLVTPSFHSRGDEVILHRLESYKEQEWVSQKTCYLGQDPCKDHMAFMLASGGRGAEQLGIPLQLGTTWYQ